MPILLVQGTLDQYGTTAQIDAATEEAYCPVDVALIEGARHAPHIDRPHETERAIAGFVSTLMETLGEAAPLSLGKTTHGD